MNARARGQAGSMGVGEGDVTEPRCCCVQAGRGWKERGAGGADSFVMRGGARCKRKHYNGVA